MELSEFINLAVTGVLTGIITYFFTVKKLKKQFQHKMLESLYEKRFSTYAELLRITQHIGKKEFSFEDHKQWRDDIQKWIATTGGVFITCRKNTRRNKCYEKTFKKREK